MNEEKFNEWFQNLGKAWESRDSEGAANLFSKDVKYYESVLDEPCENWNAVLDLWKKVPENQKEVSFNFELISVTDDLGVANWKVNRILLPSEEKQLIDGIFIIKLNSEGLCNYFKQWRTVNSL